MGRAVWQVGIVGEEPEWLRVVLDLAQLGGHGIRMPRYVIPDYVLWFETDEELRLLKIVDEDDDIAADAFFTHTADYWKEQTCVDE